VSGGPFLECVEIHCAVGGCRLLFECVVAELECGVCVGFEFLECVVADFPG
jgi:hypothetical protein